MSLEYKHQLILNIDLNQLSEATAKSVYEHNLHDDINKSRITRDELIRWASKNGGLIS